MTASEIRSMSQHLRGHLNHFRHSHNWFQNFSCSDKRMKRESKSFWSTKRSGWLKALQKHQKWWRVLLNRCKICQFYIISNEFKFQKSNLILKLQQSPFIQLFFWLWNNNIAFSKFVIKFSALCVQEVITLQPFLLKENSPPEGFYDSAPIFCSSLQTCAKFWTCYLFHI